MLQRPAVIDELRTMLSDWVASLGSPKLLGAYLFGSTVNDGGNRFQPDKGDLDVVVVVDWEAVSAGERVALINALRDAKLELETKLLRKLGRENASKQIVSLVPVTRFEIDHAVHKDGVKHILTDVRAYDLFQRSEIENLGGGRASPALADVHRTALSFVQKKRAEALSVAPNGRGGLAVQAHDDPVPKEVMRNFAIATADLEVDNDVSDLARGLREISNFASASADWTPLTSTFSDWLEVQRGARGKVPEVISDDHYLLLVETTFDRVRQQYPTSDRVRFAGPPDVPKAPPPSVPTLPSPHRLKATFRVTLTDKLGGSKGDILRAIRAARANMRARVEEPFELLFDEETGAAELLAAEDATLDAKTHRKKVKAFDRRTRIAARQARWTQGVHLILWYGGTLFQGDEDEIEEACQIAIRNWISVAATNVPNPGGVFEAFHLDFYPSHGMALSFPANVSAVDVLGTHRSLATLEPMDLAAGFVPNLVSKYLHFVSQPERSHLRDNRDKVFEIFRWDYGVR